METDRSEVTYGHPDQLAGSQSRCLCRLDDSAFQW